MEIGRKQTVWKLKKRVKKTLGLAKEPLSFYVFERQAKTVHWSEST